MANYTLGQYNHKINGNEDWMTPISTAAEIIKIQTPLDLGVTSTEEVFIEGFEDPALYFNTSFSLNTTYYCHCKIKRNILSSQKFTIKLVEAEKTDNIGSIENSIYEQFIKNINVYQGEKDNQWVDIEFIFTPQYDKFNTILIALSRTSEDFIESTKRIPLIAFLEVSVVNNALNTIVGEEISLLKMGIQSRPGLKMCINREEISIGRTGIYEIKNGEIKISFLSFISPATNKTNEELIDIKDNISFITEVSNTRPFDGFALDYIY